MRALSLAQASRCETAKHETCKCRCGGKMHGARRMIEPDDRAAYEQLPADDPHHLPTAAEIKKRRRMRRAEAKHKQTGQMTFWPAEAP